MPSASKDSYFLSVVYNSNSVKILGNVVYTRQRSLTKGFSNCDKKSKMYQQSIYISRSISEKRVRLVSSNMFKPSSNFLLTVSRRCFFCGSFFVICVSCLSVILPVLSAPCSLVVTWCDVNSHVFLSLFHMMTWVRCDIWLYRFLIFSFCLTLYTVLLFCLVHKVVCFNSAFLDDDNWASAWDFQQNGMCDQQSLRSACAYAQTDQSLC